jgi:UDP-N-acetylmuramate dehydrogenase
MASSIGLTSSPFDGSGFEHVVRENEPLGPMTWLKIGGPARYFAEPTSEDQLVQILKHCSGLGIPVRLIGGGSNLLVREAGFDGMVISLSSPAFSGIEITSNRVRCGCGARLSHLIAHAVGAGLGGLEHLVGIPGTVGGALHANASTLNGDIGQRVLKARLLTSKGDAIERSSDKLHFATGKSSLDELVILDCEFQLEPANIKTLTNRMQTLWIVKRANQPITSVACAIPFIDPITCSAANLIEQAGLKGASEGAVQLSATYPNYLIANSGATSDQVLALIDRAMSSVYKLTGVQLQLHLRIW